MEIVKGLIVVGMLWPACWLLGAAFEDGFRFWSIPMCIATALGYFYSSIWIISQ